jgi:ankyrin repeat protein
MSLPFVQSKELRMRAGLISALLGLLVIVRVSAAPDEAPLVDAARRGDTAAVRALLQRHVNANQALPDGTTAIHWAARRGDLDEIQLLIRAGADVKAANRYGMTPLLSACETGSVLTVEALLQAGADANAALPEGETPLMLAARSGKADVVRLLAVHGARVDAREGWHGQTALMWAAAEGHPAVIKTLAEVGGDLNARTPGGFTPLLFAARAGKVEAVEALLDLGVDVNDALHPTTTPPPPRMPAGGNNADPNGVVALTPSGNGEGTSTLILAITNKHWQMARLLVERGADPLDSRAGWTALHELAYIRRPNTGKGLPPQEDVEHADTLEIARMLVDYGADVNARQTKERRDGNRNELNRVGATPFLLAAKHADVPFMRFLAAHGADPAIVTARHTTALMAAAGVGVFNVGESAGTNEEALDATRLAFELGSGDVNAVDDLGWTALHGAAKRGSNEIVQFLIDHGSGFGGKTRVEGWTPLRIADGVFVGGTIKRADDTAALIRNLMRARGIEPPEKVVNDVAEVPKPSKP